METGRKEKKGLQVEKEIDISNNLVKIILKEKYLEFIKDEIVVNRFSYKEIDNKLIGHIATVLVDIDCFEKKKDARVWIQKNNLFNNLSNLKLLLDIKIEKSRLPNKDFNMSDSIMVFNEDYVDMAKKFWTLQPYYYDSSKIWWLWNSKNKFWQMVDEVDLINMLRRDASPFLNVTKNNCFSQIIKSLQFVGREKKPNEAPKKWIQFKGNAFSIKSKKTYNVTKDYFFTNPIPWDIGDNDETPTLDKLFKEWVGEKYVPTLYEIIAYCCYSDYPIQILFCLYGGGRNGKSCFLKILSKFIGTANICSTDLDLLVGRNKSRFEIFKLYKKLACLLGETNFGVLESSAILKKLTGSDLIGFEVKGKIPFDDYNYSKIIIASNSLPSSEDTSEGFYRRWLIVDFPNKFKEGKDITETVPEIEYKNLARKVCNILPVLLERGEFTNQGTIKERKDKYVMASNPLPFFIDHFCVSNHEAYIRYSFFFMSYCKFLSANKRRIVSKKEFSKRLNEEGFESRKTSKEGIVDYYVEGLNLKQDFLDFPDFSKWYVNFSCIETKVQCTEIGEIGEKRITTEKKLKQEDKKIIAEEEQIEDLIHQKCSVCGNDESHYWNPQGKPVCRDCYGAQNAQK